MDNIFITFLHFLYLWVYQFVKWILFVEVQYIFEVLSHNMLEFFLYMNANIIKSYKYFVLQFLVNKYGRPMKRKETNIG